ncbi:MAG: BON domain-containing protein [Cellvibrio sp.]
MRTLTKIFGLTLLFSSAAVMAANSVHSSSSASAVNGVVTKNADNTDLNTRDKSDNTLTPQKQTNSTSDLEVLAAVRSAIVNDKSLSIAAHNIKIVAVKGVVTLRGPVKGAAEKARVEELTRKVAGVSNIDNQLDIDTK